MAKTALFYDRELDDEASSAVKLKIGETPESKTKCLQILKDKLLSTEDLFPRVDDAFLLRYLRVAKFDADKALGRVLKYYSVKRKYAHLFDAFYPSACPTALDARHFLVSPRRAEDGSAVVFHKRGLFNPSTMKYDEVFLINGMILDYLVDNPLTQMCGATIILDLEGYNFRSFLEDTPGRLKMVVDAFQNSFPLRFQSVHVVRAPSIFSLVYNICSPFFTKKIQSRLHLHYAQDNWKRLHEMVSPDVLTQEYGGIIPDSEAIDLSREVMKEEDYFKEQLKYGYVGKKKRTGFFH